MATPDNAPITPVILSDMNWSMTHSMTNMIVHNITGSMISDTSAGVPSMNFLNMIFQLKQLLAISITSTINIIFFIEQI